MWSSIKEVIFNTTLNKMDQIQQIKVNNKVETDAAVIAEHFNDFFVIIGGAITNHLPMPTDDYFDSFSYEVAHVIELVHTSSTEVCERVNEIKAASATGPYDIPAGFLKRYKDQCSDTISNLTNDSIDTSSYPSALKESMVVPVYKEGEKQDCGNFRPVSIPTAVSKIYESFLNAWFVLVLAINNVIHRNQFGFQKNSNTTSAVTNLTHYYVTTKLDQGKFVGVIFLDNTESIRQCEQRNSSKKTSKIEYPRISHEIIGVILVGSEAIYKDWNSPQRTSRNRNRNSARIAART